MGLSLSTLIGHPSLEVEGATVSCHQATTSTLHEPASDGRVHTLPPRLNVLEFGPSSKNADLRRAKFEAVFDTIREELLDHFSAQKMPPEAVDWYRNCLNYNVPGGKLARGMSVIDTMEILRGRGLTEEEYSQAAVLGWCVELVQACGLITDDIEDDSITRRGHACWFRVPHVGMTAINDAFMLEAAGYHLLKVHFRSQPYYTDLLELGHEITYITTMGQLVDLMTAQGEQVDLNKFSLERHKLTAMYKTAYYSFYFPVALAMIVCGIPKTYQAAGLAICPYDDALSILLPLGEFFQIQDDFLDFAGTPEQTGKIGTDIIDNKCSWVINTALKLASPEQRQILDENYGRKCMEKEKLVKAVFDELDIRGAYSRYEANFVAELNEKINRVVEVGGGLKREMFRSCLKKIYANEQ